MSDDVLTDKAQILDRMEESHRAFRAALERVDPAAFERPGPWGEGTLKDLLAHLVYWQTLAAERVQLSVAGRLAEAEALSPAGDAEADERNANVRCANQSRPLAEIQQAFDVSYRTLRTTVKSVPPAMLADQSLPIYHWIAGNSFAHYEEHLTDIEKAIQSNRESTA